MNIEQIQARIEQLECLVLKQEAIIKDQQQHQVQLQNSLAEHVELMQHQKLQYEKQLHQMQLPTVPPQQQQFDQGERPQQYICGLDPHQILNQFHQIRPFGRGHHLSLFIKSVENAMSLCCQNMELLSYGLAIIKNEKLIGEAAKTASLMPENITWDKMKVQLKKDFGPRKNYSEVFNFCRNVKIKNLRELFNIFLECKFELNEIFSLDDQESPQLYEPQNVERDLTEILITKIDGQFRACIIDKNPDIESLFNRFSQLKLLDDTRAIDYRHRKTISQTHKKTSEGQNYYPSKNYVNNNKFNNNPNKFIKRNVFPSKHAKNLPTPMELGSLENSKEYQEVNFLGGQQVRNYP